MLRYWAQTRVALFDSGLFWTSPFCRASSKITSFNSVEAHPLVRQLEFQCTKALSWLLQGNPRPHDVCWLRNG